MVVSACIEFSGGLDFVCVFIDLMFLRGGFYSKNEWKI